MKRASEFGTKKTCDSSAVSNAILQARAKLASDCLIVCPDCLSWRLGGACTQVPLCLVMQMHACHHCLRACTSRAPGDPTLPGLHGGADGD